MTIFVISGLIIVLITIFYIGGSIARSKNSSSLYDLEERKEILTSQPVLEEIETVKKMHLIGQSQVAFRAINQRWTDLSTKSFADLEAQLFDIEELNEAFHFIKAKKMLATSSEQLAYMEEEVENIRGDLEQLRESEERNSVAIQTALDVYKGLKKQSNEEKEKYGSAIDEIQKKIHAIETEFTNFVTLNTNGDPIEARDVLEKAEKKTFELREQMEQIPKLFEDVSYVFPEQIKELEDGYEQLITQKFVFTEEGLEERFHWIKGEINDSLGFLRLLELADVQKTNQKIDEKIDHLYDVFETEINAKSYVEGNIDQLKEYLEHSRANNHRLLIELDHTSQSYTLNNNELGQTKNFNSKIDDLETEANQYFIALDNHQVAYSVVQNFIENGYKILAEIEDSQIKISANVKKLRAIEREAFEKLDEFEIRLKDIKRYVERRRLPGLANEYLEYFFVASDRVENLARSLNKIRINIDDIQNLVKYSAEDLEILKDKTKELVDSAALAEQMMQYANRYRYTSPKIELAIDKSLELFTTDFLYKAALDEIGTALEGVEPGAFKRIEDFYYKNQVKSSVLT